MAFYQRQAQELATITALVTRHTLLGSVWQTRTVWVRKRSHTFFDHIVAGWDEAEWKRNFRIGRPTFDFLRTAFPNCRDLLVGNLVAKRTLELPLDTVLAPNVQHKRNFGVGPHSSAIGHFLTPRTRFDLSSTHLRRWVELGCKTRVEPGSRCACERCKVG